MKNPVYLVQEGPPPEPALLFLDLLDIVLHNLDPKEILIHQLVQIFFNGVVICVLPCECGIPRPGQVDVCRTEFLHDALQNQLYSGIGGPAARVFLFHVQRFLSLWFQSTVSVLMFFSRFRTGLMIMMVDRIT